MATTKKSPVKMSMEVAKKMRKLGETKSHKAIAEQYGISTQTVRRVLDNRSWRETAYATLTNKDKAAIAKRLKVGDKTGPIAADYNVARSTIRKVRAS